MAVSNVARLHFGRLKEEQFAYTRWFVELPVGISVETVMEPTFFSHFTKQLKPLDTIEVLSEDGSWEEKFRVMFVGPGEVKIRRKADKSEPSPIGETLSDTYDVDWRGPAIRFAVINKKTKEIIKDHLYPKEEAVNYLRKHLGAMKG